MTTSQRVAAIIIDLEGQRSDLFLEYLQALEGESHSHANDIYNKVADINTHLARLFEHEHECHIVND